MLEDVEVDDTVHVMTRHGRVLGQLGLNQHQAPNEFSLTVVCEQGTARFELLEHRWRWMKEPGGTWHECPARPLEHDERFVIQANLFLDVIEGKAEPACTVAEALQTLRVNLAVLDASENPRWRSVLSDGDALS